MKIETMEKKYKALAEKHRKYLMQKNNIKKSYVDIIAKLKIVILDLINEIIKNSPDDKLLEKVQKIEKMLKEVKI